MAQRKSGLKPPTAEELGKAMIEITDKKELDQFLLRTYNALGRDKEAYKQLWCEAMLPMLDEDDEVACKNLQGLEEFRSDRPYCMMEYIIDPNTGEVV